MIMFHLYLQDYFEVNCRHPIYIIYKYRSMCASYQPNTVQLQTHPSLFQGVILKLDPRNISLLARC